MGMFAGVARVAFVIAVLAGFISAGALEVHFLRHGETTWYPLGNASAEEVKFLHDSGSKWVSLYFVQNTEEAMRVRSWKMDAFVTDHVSKVRKAYGRNAEKKGE